MSGSGDIESVLTQLQEQLDKIERKLDSDLEKDSSPSEIQPAKEEELAINAGGEVLLDEEKEAPDYELSYQLQAQNFAATFSDDAPLNFRGLMLPVDIPSDGILSVGPDIPVLIPSEVAREAVKASALPLPLDGLDSLDGHDPQNIIGAILRLDLSPAGVVATGRIFEKSKPIIASSVQSQSSSGGPRIGLSIDGQVKGKPVLWNGRTVFQVEELRLNGASLLYSHRAGWTSTEVSINNNPQPVAAQVREEAQEVVAGCYQVRIRASANANFNTAVHRWIDRWVSAQATSNENELDVAASAQSDTDSSSKFNEMSNPESSILQEIAELIAPIESRLYNLEASAAPSGLSENMIASIQQIAAGLDRRLEQLEIEQSDLAGAIMQMEPTYRDVRAEKRKAELEAEAQKKETDLEQALLSVLGKYGIAASARQPEYRFPEVAPAAASLNPSAIAQQYAQAPGQRELPLQSASLSGNPTADSIAYQAYQIQQEANRADNWTDAKVFGALDQARTMLNKAQRLANS
jgi:hypothetical protein